MYILTIQNGEFYTVVLILLVTFVSFFLQKNINNSAG